MSSLESGSSLFNNAHNCISLLKKYQVDLDVETISLYCATSLVEVIHAPIKAYPYSATKLGKASRIIEVGRFMQEHSIPSDKFFESVLLRKKRDYISPDVDALKLFLEVVRENKVEIIYDKAKVSDFFHQAIHQAHNASKAAELVRMAADLGLEIGEITRSDLKFRLHNVMHRTVGPLVPTEEASSA